MKKILFLTNKPSFYRVKFFNELGKKYNLDVYFEIKSRKKEVLRDKAWFDNQFENFNGIFLSKLVRFSKKYFIDLDLFSKIKVKKYDYVIIGQYSTLNSMLLILYMNFIKKKFILNTDGDFIKKENKLIKKIRTYFVSSAAAYISSSKKADECLEYYGADKNKIYRMNFSSYYENEIEENFVEYEEKEKIKNEKGYKYKKIVLSVANFEPRKNLEPLLQVWSELADNDKNGLILIGTGPLKQKFLDFVKEKNLNNVEILDFVEPDELKNIYRMANVLVLNSKIDIWGLTVGEGMTFGLPIICTNTCLSGTELIENEVNGYLIEDDINELKKAVIKILGLTKEQEIQISKNNLKKIKDYSIERMVEDNIRVLNIKDLN